MRARPSRIDPPTTAAEVRDGLARIRAKRGYLLPHHGLLAVAEPALLEAYDAAYTELTLTTRALGLRDKEIVWLAILVSTGEAIATHHIDRLKQGGGTQADLEAALALAEAQTPHQILRPLASTTQIAVVFCDTSKLAKWGIDPPPMVEATGPQAPGSQHYRNV